MLTSTLREISKMTVMEFRKLQPRILFSALPHIKSIDLISYCFDLVDILTSTSL